jgi:hypothetical protein
MLLNSLQEQQKNYFIVTPLLSLLLSQNCLPIKNNLRSSSDIITKSNRFLDSKNNYGHRNNQRKVYLEFRD